LRFDAKGTYQLTLFNFVLRVSNRACRHGCPDVCITMINNMYSSLLTAFARPAHLVLRLQARLP
jgi:hypothetical protein